MIFGPHNIHVRVQHIPLINLMGLMTFLKEKFFQDFGTLLAPQEKNLAASVAKFTLYQKRD